MPTQPVYIRYIDYYCPSASITTEELFGHVPEIPGASPTTWQDFARDSGIERVRTFQQGETLAEISARLFQRLLDETGVDPMRIAYLACCDRSLLSHEGSSAVHYLHDKFALKNTVLLPLLNTCAGSLLAFGTAADLLQGDEEKYLLILTASACQDLQHRYIVFSALGDGLAIALLGNKPGGLEVTNWSAAMDGTSSRSAVDATAAAERLASSRFRQVARGTGLIRASVEAAGKRMEDFAAVIPQSVHRSVYEKLYCTLLGINPSAMFLGNIADGGHMGDVDTLRNICDFVRINGGNLPGPVVVYGLDVTQSMDLTYYIAHLVDRGGLPPHPEWRGGALPAAPSLEPAKCLS